MQTIIDKLNEERKHAEAEIKENAVTIGQLEASIASMSQRSDELEDQLTAVDAAIAVLSGKVNRRTKRRK